MYASRYNERLFGLSLRVMNTCGNRQRECISLMQSGSDANVCSGYTLRRQGKQSDIYLVAGASDSTRVRGRDCSDKQGRNSPDSLTIRLVGKGADTSNRSFSHNTQYTIHIG